MAKRIGRLLPNDTKIDGMINGGDGFIYIGTTGDTDNPKRSGFLCGVKVKI